MLFRERRVTLVRKNHFVPMVNSIRIQVVRVEDRQVDIFSVRTFLRYSLKRETSSEFRDTHRLLSSPRNRSGFLGAASSDSDSDEHDSLFRFVSQTPCSIQSCRAGNPFDHGFLSPTNH